MASSPAGVSVHWIAGSPAQGASTRDRQPKDKRQCGNLGSGIVRVARQRCRPRLIALKLGREGSDENPFADA
jgi:hypothetical protein